MKTHAIYSSSKSTEVRLEFSQIEQGGKFLEVWQRLNSTEISDLEFDNSPEKFDKSAVQDFFEQSEYRFIDLSCLTEVDRKFIEERKISVANLISNQFCITAEHESHDALGQYIAEQKERGIPKSRRHIQRIEAVTEFQTSMICDGFLYAVCPISGKIIKTNRSLYPPHMYYFNSDLVFYLITGDVWLEKVGIYFPDFDLIVELVPASDQMKQKIIQTINALKINAVLNKEKINQYILNSSATKKAVILKINHYAHHLWNELTGIHKLLDNNLLASIDKFLVMAEPIGCLEDIFPEIPCDRVERMGIKQFYEKVLRENYFVVCLGDCIIKSDLADRVHRASLKYSSNQLQLRVDEARGKHSLLLWVSLRLGSRTWIAQTEEIAKIINRLYDRFSNLGIVIDGFSFPYGQSCYSNPKTVALINRLKDTRDELLSFLQPDIITYDIIGCPMHESIVWAHTADFYLTHQGSLQHRVGWIANKPGVVHTNTSVLSMPLTLRPGCWERESGILPIYISAEDVQDVGGEVFAHGKLSTGSNQNYNCDAEKVYEAIYGLASSVLQAKLARSAI